MPYVTPEAIAAAKEMDILTYLQTYEPQELVKFSGNVYCTREHDSLKISNGKWYWWSRGVGGRSALDYLIKVRGMRLPEAVERITGQATIRPPAFIDRPKEEKKTLVLPSNYRYTDCVREYLCSRGLDPEIVEHCIDTGRIYENHNRVASDKVFVNVVFVGFDAACEARYATLRGVRSDFKGEAIGSDKRYSFSLAAESESPVLHLFESAIDLLSYATLIKRSGADWRSENLLSLAGIYQPKKNIEDSKLPAALSRFLLENPHVHKVKLHIDNDHAGKEAARAILAIIPDMATNDPPMFGKDVNDMLRQSLGMDKHRDAR